MPDYETLYPLEIRIGGVPVSQQGSSRSKERWKSEVSEAARKRQQETYDLGILDDRVLAVTIYYFPAAPMEGDIDNIVKPIMDGLIGVAYISDQAIERVIVQKFEPDDGWEFAAPSDQLAAALDTAPPVVYVRIDDDLSWRRLS